MYEDYLCDIGLNKSEAKVFIELLRIGSQPVSVLAKKTGILRTSIYSVLRNLQLKGLISTYTKNNLKMYSANDPNCLVAYLDSKCKTYNFRREQMLTVVPKFRDLISSYSFKKPLIGYYEEVSGVKYVVKQLLQESHIFSYFSLKDLLNPLIEPLLFQSKKMTVVVPDNKKVRDFFKNCSFDQELVFVNPDNIENYFVNNINIANSKVSILNLEKSMEYAVYIENKEIALTQKAIFEIVCNSNK